MNYFQEQGRTLLAHGYQIIPIKPGAKRPAIDAWQSSSLGASDLTKYSGHGVGIITGRGDYPIAAVDIDCTDEALTSEFVTWCDKHLGSTVQRVGKYPKILLVYRAEKAGIGKQTGTMFTDAKGVKHRLEVLGKGQQFVAYHIHPDTKRPYEWIDLCGGLEEMPAKYLPVITETQMLEAVRVFDKMAIDAGFTKAKGSSAAPRVGGATSSGDSATGFGQGSEGDDLEDVLTIRESKVGDITLEDVAKNLHHVSNEDYVSWLNTGMALHHEYDASDEALALWDKWSSTADSYKGFNDLESRWVGFGSTGRRPVTMRWLLKIWKETAKAENKEAVAATKALIEDCDDASQLLSVYAAQAGELAGDDIAIKAEFIGLIRQRFKALTKTVLGVVDLREALAGGKKVVKFEPNKRLYTEFGNCERMLDKYGNTLMYVPQLERWFQWNGVYWKMATFIDVLFLAKKTITELPNELAKITDDSEKVAFFKFCAESQAYRMADNMVKLARADERVMVPVGELDKESRYLGTQNGAVDLKTGRLLDPNPAMRITMATSVEYDEDAKCPLFEQTVSDVFFGNKDKVSFFQRLIGYSLMGDPTEDILAIPFGSGSNGKSTVLGIVREVLGDYARTADSDTFLSAGSGKGNAGGPREDLVRLRGSRFVYVTEPDEGSELREGIIKAVTGGDDITARGQRALDSVQIKPTWVTFMPTNHRPTVKGDDNGIWRRLLLVPFERNFENDPTIVKDGSRAGKLAKERKGVLRWCVEGALSYQKEGLKKTGDILKAVEEYRMDMDLLGEWVGQCLVADNAGSVPVSACWASWNEFARGTGDIAYISNQRKLTQRLSAKYKVVRTGGVRKLYGFTLKSSDDFA